jgi:hypothetical protein
VPEVINRQNKESAKQMVQDLDKKTNFVNQRVAAALQPPVDRPAVAAGLAHAQVEHQMDSLIIDEVGLGD